MCFDCCTDRENMENMDTSTTWSPASNEMTQHQQIQQGIITAQPNLQEYQIINPSMVSSMMASSNIAPGNLETTTTSTNYHSTGMTQHQPIQDFNSGFDQHSTIHSADSFTQHQIYE